VRKQQISIKFIGDLKRSHTCLKLRLGSHPYGALAARGNGLRVLDELSIGSRGHLPPGAELIEGNVANAALVRRAPGAGRRASLHPAADLLVERI